MSYASGGYNGPTDIGNLGSAPVNISDPGPEQSGPILGNLGGSSSSFEIDSGGVITGIRG